MPYAQSFDNLIALRHSKQLFDKFRAGDYQRFMKLSSRRRPASEKSTAKKTRSIKPIVQNRAMLERIQKLIQRVASGDYPNCQQMAREMEFSPRTLYRDIDFMRDRLGIPIEFDALRNGYYFSGEVASFPEVKLQVADLVALFVGEKVLSQYSGTGLERHLRGVFERLLGTMRDEISISWQELDTMMSFKVSGTAERDISLFDELAGAVSRLLEIEIIYQKLAAKKPECRKVHPLHLTSFNGFWYLLGHDVGRNAIRTFALSRIESIKTTGQTFERPKDFDPNKWFKNSFGIFHEEGQPIRVRVKFEPPVSRLIAERQWHTSQQLRQLDGDSIEISLLVSNLTEVRNWIMSWGGAAEVIEPEKLRTMICEEAVRMLQRYEAHRGERKLL